MGGLAEGFADIGAGKQANEVAKRNALIDEQDARVAMKDARFNAALEQRRGVRIQAEQAVRFGKGGVQADVGSPLLLAAQESVNASLRASGELRQGAAESRRRRESAFMQRFRGKAAKRAGFIRGGTKIIKTIAGSGTGMPSFGSRSPRTEETNVLGGISL